MTSLWLLACRFTPPEVPGEPLPKVPPTADTASTGIVSDHLTPIEPEDTGPPPTPPGPVRFVVLGDAGTGDERQRSVADAMATVCAVERCDFALYVGDNFYSSGVSSLDDIQFEDKFEIPYAALDFTFHAVVGNHDNGDGSDPTQTALEVAYSGLSQKWSMPAAYYTFTEGDATFFALDTTVLVYGDDPTQAGWLPSEIAAATTPWKFAFGHHPYLSNGPHGNAREDFGAFVEANLCGQVDAYFCGHDHDLEWLQTSCPGTEFLVSGGGGASSYTIVGSNPAWFTSASLGFLWVEIDGRAFTGVFYDGEGTEVFRLGYTK